jgi:hypothetical protein
MEYGTNGGSSPLFVKVEGESPLTPPQTDDRMVSKCAMGLTERNPGMQVLIRILRSSRTHFRESDRGAETTKGRRGDKNEWPGAVKSLIERDQWVISRQCRRA